MPVILSKTDYILFRECPKNVWFKIHRPDIYSQSELSEFEKSIIETGNEVELVARGLFPNGILIEGRDSGSRTVTQELLAEKASILFQPAFLKENMFAAIDILKYNAGSGAYLVYEVKATNDVDAKGHYHDLSFQISLLRKCGLKVEKAYVIHLNSEYVRSGALDLAKLFKIVDVSSEIKSLSGIVEAEALEALKYLSQDSEPKGFCCCVYKGRSRHCSTFRYSNPEIPEYGVHDIARIGNSKAKLKELIDSNIFHLERIPKHFKLSDIQQCQIDAHVLNKVFVKKEDIAEELKTLTFPLYFLDYETLPAAIPQFNQFSPYNQIPFQYSVHILDSADSIPRHFEFLHLSPEDPSRAFSLSLQKHIGSSGTIIVWHKSFECGRNNEIAARVPENRMFMESLNNRVYDLEDIFKKQYHVHKDFKGSTSIKYILPVLVPDLSYEDLEIREGGTASETWNKIMNGSFNDAEKEKAIKDLKTYCGLDTYAMYSIWHALVKLV